MPKHSGVLQCQIGLLAAIGGLIGILQSSTDDLLEGNFLRFCQGIIRTSINLFFTELTVDGGDIAIIDIQILETAGPDVSEHQTAKVGGVDLLYGKGFWVW